MIEWRPSPILASSRRASRAAGLLAASLSIAAAVAPVHAEEPYKINAILPLTGQASFLGKEEQVSLQIAEKYVNRTGGIHGRPLQFVFHDDTSSPQVGVQLVREVSAEKPAVILGSSLVAVCSAMVPLMKEGPVEYCFSPGVHPEAGSYAFSASVSTHDLQKALFRYFRENGWKRIAIMTSSDATGQDAERGIDETLSQPEYKDAGLDAGRARAFQQHHRRQRRRADRDGEGRQARRLRRLEHGDADRHHLQGHPAGRARRPHRHHRREYDLRSDDQLRGLPAEAALFSRGRVAAARGRAEARSRDREAATGVLRRVQGVQGVELDNVSGDARTWGPAVLVTQALRELGPDATATEIRDYLAKLKGTPGIDGFYDFPATPQRGLDDRNAVVTRWEPGKHAWVVLSEPGGMPLK